jgi:hypothetical protein
VIEVLHIEAKFRELIQNVQSIGWNVAADNLERFLNGVSGTAGYNR